MALPGVVVNILSAIASRTLPSGTGVGFFAGITERGTTAKALAIKSLQDFTDRFGARTSATTAILFDAVETFFAEGGTDLWIGRVFGAGAVAATRNLLDSGSGISLVVKAGYRGDQDPGTWGNSLKVAVVAVTGGFRIDVYRTINSVDVLVESSYTCVTQADAIAWSIAASNYIVLSLGATALVPAAAAAAALSSGTDGSAVADSDWALALTLFDRDYGAGQICAPGRSTSAGHLQLLAHAVANNRFALLDGVDTATAATLVSAAQGLYTSPSNGRRYGQYLAPWDVIPGVTALSLRTVAPSARLAAQYARVDALGNPNIAAAGPQGRARFVVDLSQPAWSDSDRQALNEAGVTVSRRKFGVGVVTYGLRTLADQVADAQWSMAPNVRCVMYYAHHARDVGEDNQFGQTDGQGHALATFKGGLVDLANDLFGKGALYGQTPDEAFYVDIGGSINTDVTLAAGEKHARVALRTSPSNERTVIDVVKTPITQALA